MLKGGGILWYRYWQEARRRNNEIGEDKGRFGELRACPPALTASPDRALRAGLMDAPLPPPPPSHFPPSFCEVSCSPRVKHTGVWEEDLMHTLTLHKDFMTAWELSRNVFCHIDSWDFFFYIYGVRLQPGNYAVLIGPSDWHPEQLYSHKEIIHT